MYNSHEYFNCTRSEMDITTVFGTVVGGSNPSGCTQCPVLLKNLYRVRFLVEYVDNYVGNVDKGQC